MQRKLLYTSLTSVALVSAVVGVASIIRHSNADQGDPQIAPKQVPSLPIAQVVLFNSGVGYFQREGDVNGDARVELTFPTSDVNDLLKSLVLQDTAGGRIGAISYDSQDPVEKILRSFALDLNGNPTYGQILNQARGEKIEVMRQEKPGANPHKVTGTIIGIEAHEEVTKDMAARIEQLNLLTTEGMLNIPLPQVLSVRFQNQTLETEFRRALQVLAGSHDVQKKTVALHFNGNGKRGVKVGYVVERPIWKTTYRLELKPNGALFIQGWGIVENTSDDDWNNVRMVLVSGKPISFRMDLYDPLYIPRPLVEPELFASLRPPVYGGSFAGDAANPFVGRVNPYGGIPGSGGVGGGLGGIGGMPAPAPVQGRANDGQFKNIQGQKADEKGASNAFSNNGLRDSDSVQGATNLAVGNSKLGYDEMMQRKAQQREALEMAKRKGSDITGLNFKEGIQSVATSDEVGDYYQYMIDQKISLARQKSAMLPIINQSISGSKVSIYNEGIHAKYPLLGIRLKNSSGKPLTQGPITVYEDGSYAGDTRTLDLQPNEERLLSYALDQGTEVKTAVKTHAAPELTMNIGGDNLTAHYTMRQTRSYTVKNRSVHDRTLIIEHPIRSDWKLVDPKKPSDRSRDVYRFQVEVKAGQTVSQEVIEEQTRTDPVALQARGKDVPPHYAILDGIEIKPEIKATGGKLMALTITKGVLEATYKQKESKTYFIQNQSERDHVFNVDHVIRKEWKRLAADGKDQSGPDVFHFKVEVKSKKTAHQEVVEEHVYIDHSTVVANVDEASLRKFIAHEAPTATVKTALQQVVNKQTTLKAAKQELAAAKEALRILAEDQGRVRENLKIIPQTSEHFKDFLKKFVAQEAQIDDVQKQIRTQEATLQTMQKEYEAYVTGLNVQ